MSSGSALYKAIRRVRSSVVVSCRRASGDEAALKLGPKLPVFPQARAVLIGIFLRKRIKWKRWRLSRSSVMIMYLDVARISLLRESKTPGGVSIFASLHVAGMVGVISVCLAQSHVSPCRLRSWTSTTYAQGTLIYNRIPGSGLWLWLTLVVSWE